MLLCVMSFFSFAKVKPCLDLVATLVISLKLKVLPLVNTLTKIKCYENFAAFSHKNKKEKYVKITFSRILQMILG